MTWLGNRRLKLRVYGRAASKESLPVKVLEIYYSSIFVLAALSLNLFYKTYHYFLI